MALTRLRISKYILLHLNYACVASPVWFKPSKLFNTISLWTGKAQTRLCICKYILLHLNHLFDSSRMWFKPSTLFHTILLLNVSRDDFDETAHKQIYTITFKLAHGASRVWF